MADAETSFTRDDLNLIADELHVELINGQLLKLAPSTMHHDQLVMWLLARLIDFAGEERVRSGPVRFPIDEFNVFVPDAVVFAPGTKPEQGAQVAGALAVFEVLSHATAKRGHEAKVQRYLDAGVREVWSVDPDGGVEVRRADGVEAALPGFALGDDYFRGDVTGP